MKFRQPVRGCGCGSGLVREQQQVGEAVLAHGAELLVQPLVNGLRRLPASHGGEMLSKLFVTRFASAARRARAPAPARTAVLAASGSEHWAQIVIER